MHYGPGGLPMIYFTIAINTFIASYKTLGNTYKQITYYMSSSGDSSMHMGFVFIYYIIITNVVH